MPRSLYPIKSYVIDNDDYSLATEIFDKVSSVLDEYFSFTADSNQYRDAAARLVQDIIKDLHDWMGEYEAEHPEQKQPTPSAVATTANAEAKSRTINESELEKYFNVKFKGAGNNMNYFELLVSDLKDLTTIKDFRAVAVMIWECKTGFIKSFSTFAKWCRTFFDCVGVEVKPKYNYSKKEIPSDELKRKFYYLV